MLCNLLTERTVKQPLTLAGILDLATSFSVALYECSSNCFQAVFKSFTFQKLKFSKMVNKIAISSSFGTAESADFVNSKE